MILLTGTNGLVGARLAERWRKSGQDFCSVSRSKPKLKSLLGLPYISWDMSNGLQSELDQYQGQLKSLIHCAPIWLLPRHVNALHQLGVNRIVAFSSTSVFGKKQSSNEHEQQIVSMILEAESSLQESCSNLNIDLTILRPTMIYGYGRDENVYRIAKLFRRFRIFPIVGQAKGLRQPVHCDDLAWAADRVINESVSYNKAYNLVGGETLRYREMLDRIRMSQKGIVIFLTVPRWVFVLLVKVLSWCSSFDYNIEMVDRMNQDLVFDIAAAAEDFSYRPQLFLNDPMRDLP